MPTVSIILLEQDIFLSISDPRDPIGKWSHRGVDGRAWSDGVIEIARRAAITREEVRRRDRDYQLFPDPWQLQTEG